MYILSRVESDNAYVSILLDAELRKIPALDPRERALVTELVYGVTRWQKTLDWYLNQVCKKPLQKTAPVLRQLLRLGAYQLFMLEKIPPSAAVNETVKLAGKYAKRLRLPAKTAKGVVNGVLRQLQRQRDTLKSPETLSDVCTRLAYQYSFPEWMVKRWVARLGEEQAEEACRIHNQPPHLMLRVNTLKTSLPDIQRRLAGKARSMRPLPGNLPGLVVSGTGPVSDLTCYQNGLCTIQNASSMLIALLLDPQPGEHILETCAGTGIKIAHIGELMGNQGQITAVDLYEKKLRRLRENCHRLGISIVRTYCGDMTTSHELPGYRHNASTGVRRRHRTGFDRILVDAPCSGFGVLRKHPEAKWTRRESQFAEFQALQLQLLSQAATLLRSDGGVLVYSTCTTEPEENEDVIIRFLVEHKGFRLESLLPCIPEELQQCVTSEGFLRIDPPQGYFDGFFCAKLIFTLSY